MTTNHDERERRAFPRYPVRESSSVMLSPDAISSLCILDISKSGIGFCYADRMLESKLLDKAFIALLSENVIATDIPVIVMSDEEVDGSKVWFTNEMDKVPDLRRCGLMFGPLSFEQKGLVENYINSLIVD